MTIAPATAAADVADFPVFDHQTALRLCEEAGWTYTEVGARVGKGYHSARDYLLGRTDPPAAVISALALILDVPLDDLFRPATEDDVNKSKGLIIRARTPDTSRSQRLLQRR